MRRALCPVLVGRELELRGLEEALCAADRGDGQVVVLAGEAGMGKTRLAREIQRLAVKRDVVTLWGGCSEAPLALPYLPIVEAIGNYLAGARTEQFGRQLGSFQRDLAQLFPQLDSGLQPLENVDPIERKLRLFEALVSLVRIISKDHPVLLVAEDLHWSDASTLELLDYTIRRIAKARVMLLVTYRSDDLHREHPLGPWLKAWRQGAKIVELQPLPASQVALMVAASLGLETVGADFRDFLHARSEGNPFVLEEVLRAALDQHVNRAVADLDQQTLAELKIPETVRELVRHRVERLSEEHGEILKAASVLGSVFSYRLLVDLSKAREETVQAALQAAVDEQLVSELPGEDGMFRFRHALTREAVYEDLIRPKRDALHTRAANVLRVLPGAPSIDLAHHLLAASQWIEAIPICLRAAEEAEQRSGFREAADLYGRVLPHVKDKRRRAQVLCRLGRAHFFTGDAIAEPYLTEGIELMEECEQIAEAAGYRHWLARFHWLRSRHDLARLEYERARASLEPCGASEELAYIYIRLAHLHNAQFEMRESLLLARLALATAEVAGADAARIWAYGSLGVALTFSNQVDEGIEYLDRSYREAAARGLSWIAGNSAGGSVEVRSYFFRASETSEAVDVLRNLAGLENQISAEYYEGMRLFRLGDPRDAAVRLEKALGYVRDEFGYYFVWINAHLALVYGSLGRFAEARRVLPARDLDREKQDTALLAYAAVRINLDAGDLRAALHEVENYMTVMDWTRANVIDEMWWLDVATEALLRSEKTADTGRLVAQARPLDPTSPHLRRMHGRLMLAEGNAATAVRELMEVADFFEDAGYREESSRTRRALAQAKALAGDRAGAEVELRRVLAYAEAYGAAFEGVSARRLVSKLGIRGIPRGSRPSTRSHLARLTNRELEVLKHMADGLGNQEIASRLFLSPKTIDHHVSSILGKLGVHSRMEAVRAAERLGALGQIRESPSRN